MAGSTSAPARWLPSFQLDLGIQINRHGALYLRGGAGSVFLLNHASGYLVGEWTPLRWFSLGTGIGIDGMAIAWFGGGAEPKPGENTNRNTWTAVSVPVIIGLQFIGEDDWSFAQGQAGAAHRHRDRRGRRAEDGRRRRPPGREHQLRADVRSTEVAGTRRRRRWLIASGRLHRPQGFMVPIPLPAVATETRAREPSDDALMTLAVGDDPRAFTLLVARYETRVRGFCRMLLKDDATARDVAQDVFTRVWEGRGRYRPQGHFKELLFTVARNRCRSTLRAQRFRAFFGATAKSAEAERSGADQSQAMEAEQRRRLIAAALEKLPEKFRVPLALRFVDDMPYEEIATVIGRTTSAARSRVFYGLEELARLLPPEVLS
ncbi:MAG: RNA polymerase sigma factor [Myxococcales bacterium]